MVPKAFNFTVLRIISVLKLDAIFAYLVFCISAAIQRRDGGRAKLWRRLFLNAESLATARKFFL